MSALRRHLNLPAAFAAICLSGAVHGAMIEATGKPVGAPIAPAIAQSWASSINGYFASPSPDLKVLSGVLASLNGIDFSDPRTREALSPVFAAVQAQARDLSGASATAAATPALAEKYAALDTIFGDFMTPASRPYVRGLARGSREALSGADRAKLQEKMQSMVAALGRTLQDDAQGGVAVSDVPQKARPGSKLRPAPWTPPATWSPKEIALYRSFEKWLSSDDYISLRFERDLSDFQAANFTKRELSEVWKATAERTLIRIKPLVEGSVKLALGGDFAMVARDLYVPTALLEGFGLVARAAEVKQLRSLRDTLNKLYELSLEMSRARGSKIKSLTKEILAVGAAHPQS